MEPSHIFNQFLKQLEKHLLAPVTDTLFAQEPHSPASTPFAGQSMELQKASSLFAFLSTEHPIIGKSTEDRNDVEITRQFLRLNTFQEEIANFLSYEMITKIIAYRNLAVGDRFEIPFYHEHQRIVVPFVVEAIFDLWLKIPAFALTSQNPAIPSILLFKGTVFSMTTTSGIASVLTDLDPEGPGFKMFLKSRDELQNYLREQGKKVKPRVMGYSLGGSLASYCLLFDYDLINASKEFPSVIFQAPGIYDKNLDVWNTISPHERPSVITFVAKGDLISKVGTHFGDIVEISLKNSLPPITSHVQFYLGQKDLYAGRT